MSMGLTPRQSECLAFIRAYIAANGIAPSITELADGIGNRSKSAVTAMMRSLEERGYIRRLPHKARAIEVIEQQPATQSVALNPEIARLVRSYAEQEGIQTDTAANELLRQALGVAA